MTTKQSLLIEEFLNTIEVEYKPMFRELIDYVMSFQFNPIKNKTQDLTIDFKNNKLKKTIMKIEVFEQPHDDIKYKERAVPGLRLKYYATKDYSKIFQDAIKRVIEEFEGKYTGCYACGRCKEKPQGYIYAYPNQKKVFRCGSELIPVFDFTEKNIDEIKQLIKNQVEYWRRMA